MFAYHHANHKQSDLSFEMLGIRRLDVLVLIFRVLFPLLSKHLEQLVLLYTNRFDDLPKSVQVV